MTLLILLVSIAVLEYVLRRPDTPPRRNTKTTENKEFTAPDPGQHQNSEPTLAPGLFQLGRAVEQFGRGPMPQPSPQPEQKPTPDKQRI